MNICPESKKECIAPKLCGVEKRGDATTRTEKTGSIIGCTRECGIPMPAKRAYNSYRYGTYN